MGSRPFCKGNFPFIGVYAGECGSMTGAFARFLLALSVDMEYTRFVKATEGGCFDGKF